MRGVTFRLGNGQNVDMLSHPMYCPIITIEAVETAKKIRQKYTKDL